METGCSKTLAVLGGLGTLFHAEHAAELACHLCEAQAGELLFVYPIIVPQSMPLNASLPEQELAANDAITRGLAVASRFGCHAEARIVRARRAAEAILELAVAEHVDRIVLGVHMNRKVPHDYDRAESVELEIVHRAECEVIVDREAMAA
jgi:hypothetical protein